MTSNQDNNLEKLLNELKSEHKTAKKPQKQEKSDNTVNKLLEEVKFNLNHKKASNQDIDSIKTTRQKKVSDNTINSLIEETKLEISQNKISNQANKNNISQNYAQVNQDIESIKTKYDRDQNYQKQQAELIYDKNKQEIIHQEQQKQLKHKELIRQAEKWLENLDPTSDEGMWFNELAESYPSRLDAALNYLNTLNQIDA